MLKKDLEQELNRTKLVLDYAREELQQEKEETERLNKQIEEYQKALDETTSEKIDLEKIIKEVREYIEEHSEMTDLQINGIENILAFRGSCKKLLSILDKVGSGKE